MKFSRLSLFILAICLFAIPGLYTTPALADGVSADSSHGTDVELFKKKKKKKGKKGKKGKKNKKKKNKKKKNKKGKNKKGKGKNGQGNKKKAGAAGLPGSDSPTSEEMSEGESSNIPNFALLPNLESTTVAYTIFDLVFGSRANFDQVAAALQNNPSADDCDAFLPATVGVDAGFLGCKELENAAFPFQATADAVWPLCVASNLVTKQTLEGGGVTVTEGKFNSQAGYSAGKTYKFIMPNGDTIFKTINSHNKLNNDITAWQCSPGDSHARKFMNATMENRESYTGTYWGVFGTDTRSGTFDLPTAYNSDSDTIEVTLDGNRVFAVTNSNSLARSKYSLSLQNGEGVYQGFSIDSDGGSSYKDHAILSYHNTGTRYRADLFAGTVKIGSAAERNFGISFGQATYETVAATSSLTTQGPFFEIAPEEPTTDNSAYPCDQAANVTFTVTNTEEVETAKAACDAIPQNLDLCSAESVLGEAFKDYLDNCS